LVPEDWSADDGGALDLFASENGQPTKVSKSVVPSRNAFAFFEVSPASHHQVEHGSRVQTKSCHVVVIYRVEISFSPEISQQPGQLCY
jgi:Rps23 Pro-64 3,4-dihydroxylase Tpa1-like proline 4-hydroxylase